MTRCACGCPPDVHSLPDDGCINFPDCKCPQLEVAADVVESAPSESNRTTSQ